MHRRTFLVAGASIVVALTSNVLGFTRVTASSSPILPWSVPAQPPTVALPADDVSPPGGLGNSRDDFEKVNGTPTGLQGTMIAYQNGSRAASFNQDRTSGIFLSFGDGKSATFDEARAVVATMLPTDRTAVGTISAGPNRVAEVYHSDRLAGKVAPPTKSVPGQFVVVYESDASGKVSSVLAMVGDVPPT
jgi:hypothetical protein